MKKIEEYLSPRRFMAIFAVAFTAVSVPIFISLETSSRGFFYTTGVIFLVALVLALAVELLVCPMLFSGRWACCSQLQRQLLVLTAVSVTLLALSIPYHLFYCQNYLVFSIEIVFCTTLIGWAWVRRGTLVGTIFAIFALLYIPLSRRYIPMDVLLLRDLVTLWLLLIYSTKYFMRLTSVDSSRQDESE